MSMEYSEWSIHIKSHKCRRLYISVKVCANHGDAFGKAQYNVT